MPSDSQIRVLLADESAAVRAEATSLLEAAGCEVASAQSGEEAFALALERTFDIVITDIAMGRVGGLHLCRLLRAMPATATVPIVVLTANDHPRDRFWARHAGADHTVETRSLRTELPDAIELLARRSTAVVPSVPTSVGTPFERLTTVMDEMLFAAIISSETHRLVQAVDDPGGLARELVMLAAELVDTQYLVLTLGAGAAATTTVYAKGPWPRDDANAFLAELGVADPAAADLLLDEREAWSDPVAGERTELPIGQGGALGRMVAFGGRTLLSASDRATLALLARESAIVVKAAMKTAQLAGELRALARTDALTGLGNRRAATERLSHEVQRAQRQGIPFAIALCDVDRFKSINDTYGHAVGDTVLRSLAGVIGRSIRGIDFAARWGGEELLLVLPGAGEEGARIVAERVRAAIAQAPSVPGGPPQVTVDIGVATSPTATVDALVERADRALYRAKGGGRNRVEIEG